MGKTKRSTSRGLEDAETCALWSLMLWEQTTKALDKEHGEGFAAKSPELVAMCMQAGSAALIARNLARLGRVLADLE